MKSKQPLVKGVVELTWVRGRFTVGCLSEGPGGDLPWLSSESLDDEVGTCLPSESVLSSPLDSDVFTLSAMAASEVFMS